VKFLNSLFGPREKDGILTISNLITLGGILSGLIYALFYVYGANRWLILSVLFLIGFSDLSDGFLARRLRQSTNFGKIIDPVRDRILLFAIFGHIALLVGFNAQIAVIIFFEGIIIGFDVIGFPRELVWAVHLMGKLRQLIHVLSGGIVIANNLFPEIIFMIYPFTGKISANFLLTTMLISSLLVAVVYSLLQVVNIRTRRID